MSKAVSPVKQIATAIRAVQEREQKEVLKFLASAKKRSEARKYNLVELGWNLLRLKEATPHGNVENQHAAKNKSETVSDLFSGFETGVQQEFDIEPRSARNYMNAARNAGLTAESTAADMASLRKKKALAATPLAILYRSPEGEQREQSPIEHAKAQRLMAEITFTHGRSGLLHRIHETIIEHALFAHLSGDQIERLYHELAAATDKVAEHRSNPARLRLA